MKIIYDGTKVPNDTICGFDERKYPRLNKHGKPLPGHGYYVLEGKELEKAKADEKKEAAKADTSKEDAEKQWLEVRKKRDELLKAIIVDDNMPKKKKEAFDKYRKAIENIDKDFKNPADVVWPDIPEK